MSTSPESGREQEEINFFIPMVDLMVAVLFVFIIIIMVLVLLIREEESRSPSQSEIVNKSPRLITNESAVGKLVDNITQKTLKREGADLQLDKGVLRTTISPPAENRVLKD